MRKRVISVAICSVLAASIVTATAAHAAKFGGQTLGELMAQYWAWRLGTDQPGQVKNIVFLPVPNGEPSAADPTVFEGEADVTLRVGQKFTLPVFVFVGEAYAEPGIPADDPASIPAELFTDARVLVTLDGKPLIDSEADDLDNFYFDTLFDAPIPYDEPVEYGPGVHAISALWLKGLGIVHQPLPKGVHTLELFVYADAAGFGFHNTWTITVTK